jgi:PQQ-dependent dehydrogenase (s-GDH family)
MFRNFWLLCILAIATTILHAQTPVVNAKKRTATITINGNPNESIWGFTNNVTKTIVGTPNNTVTYAVLWDSLYLYVAVKVIDANKFNDSSNPWDDDAVEIYIDAENNGGTSYGANDRQIMKEWNSSAIWEKNNKTTGITHGWSNITGGYAIEMRIPWSNMGITNPGAGFTIGFDVAGDDDDNGSTRESQLMWAGDANNWQYPQNFGDLVLTTGSDTQAPTAPSNLAESAITQSSLTLTWTASTDNIAVTGYDVFRNGTKINTSLITSTTYNVTGLSASTAYQFYVQAKDAAGNTSPNSNTINITTPDTQAPTAPASLAASAITQTTLTLNWTASTDNVGVTGYDIYQNGVKINTSLITTASYNVTGLTASTSYQYYVQAKDAAGNTSANSNTINITTAAPPDTEAPAAPDNLTASNITQSSVTITWSASTDNIGVTGYDIYQNGIKINTSLVTTTSYNITGLSALITYSFYVVARDAAGNTSANSNTASITTPDTQPPTPPANLAASAITQTSLTLDWTASTDNIGVTGYDIYQDNVKINTSPVIITSYAISGLTTNTAYAFIVQASDGSGNTTNSSTLNVTTLPPPDTEAPSAPTNLAASAITQSTLTLNWTASTDNVAVSGYDVFQNGIKINASNITATSYNVSGLVALTSYDFYVVAKDAAGNVSDNSIMVNVTTPDTQAPTAPSGLASSNLTATSLTLTWNASTDNIGVTGYDIYQNGIKINVSVVTTTSYNVTGLSQATAYNFYAKALDGAGNVSANSNTVNVTTPDVQAPTAPADLASSNLTSTSLTLSWTASTDNVAVTGYDVYRNAVKINTSIVTTTSYNVTGLTASTAYSFYVQARDAAGNISANSNTINVTTPAAPGCTGTGTINFQKWNSITGTTVTSLTSNANYPNTPSTSGTLTSFEIPTSSGDNYGMRVYGYICPPATGSYTFWIASDDNGELWLSTNSSPASKQKIAYHTSYTNSREWNKFTTQKSAAITLTAGQLYYVEALMKEGTGGDNMAVGWAKPGQATTTPSEVIPGSQLLTQIPDAQPPTTPTSLNALNIGETSFSLVWNASTDNIGIAGYDIYRNGTKINTSVVTGLAYNVTGLTAGTTYTFTVIAKDVAGNSSPASSGLVVTTFLSVPIETFTMRTVIASQRMPHDLVYGPDNNIWYTERFAGKVSFVNPATGVKTVVLTLGSNMVLVSGQDGLMGLALHPQFRQGKPYAYISYTYQSLSSTVRKTRIERYTYDSVAKQLIQPVTILQDIPGSNDHNSARLAIGPDLKLYYTVGDMGAGQFDNLARTNNAQNTSIYEGKVLRLNTEPISSSWIPIDNPFGNAVYTYGHRNPQGLVWGNVNGTNILYSSEHGPYSDDELNIVEAGRNYGWPKVVGFCDGNYNGRYVGGGWAGNEQNNCATLNVREPIRSLFPVTNPPDSTTGNMTWPSTAPSGTDFYGSTAIPGWQNSLLVAQLKKGTVSRFKLSSDGLSIISDTIHYFRGLGRFRDVVVSADGLKIYVACDSSGSTSGPTGGVTATPANPGSILEFTYQPPQGGRMMNPPVVEVKSADNVKDKSIDIYPNPASSYFIVYNYALEEGRRLELIDLNGKTVKKMSAVNLATRIEVGDIANGLYILKITDGKSKTIRTEKIIIQR